MKALMKSTVVGLTMLAASVATTTSSWAGDVLDQVMSTKVLKVATDANWPPMSFLNEDNEMDGFDVSVAREIGKRMGAEVEFITPQWSVITAGSWNGRWDISVGSMTPTPERAKVLGFPAVYYYTPAGFVVHNDSPYQDKLELNGKIIGAGQATVYETYLKGELVIDAVGAPPFVFDVKPSEWRSYESSTTGLDDLRLGDGVRIDAVLGGLPTFAAAIEAGYPVRIIGTPAFYEPLSVAIDLGDPELDAKLKSIVQSMHDDGTLSMLSKKWMNADYSSLQ
jgi:polar amino acid transport system substrate-binding protein